MKKKRKNSDEYAWYEVIVKDKNQLEKEMFINAADYKFNIYIYIYMFIMTRRKKNN